ncbi:MAG: type II secretion system protein [Candidatus Pacebacteria bacterium]|nr:type II secretion system protein [Candidatus Paceibacterota bacterium]
MYTKTRKREGFTLVEMLVVVAIIAILSSIFLVGLRGFRAQAYDTRRISDVQKIQSQLELFYNQQRRYPTTLSELSSVGGYTAPTDPVTRNAYSYVPCGGGAGTNYQSYVIGATLDNKSSVLDDQNELDDADIGAMSCVGTISCGTDGTNEKEYCVGPGSSN